MAVTAKINTRTCPVFGRAMPSRWMLSSSRSCQFEVPITRKGHILNVEWQEKH